MSTLTVTSGSEPIDLEVQDSGGSGRPVVLVHGWPLSHESWSEQVPALREAGYRVVTYDRRGFGSSAKPERGYDYDTLSDDLHGILEALDLTDVTLVGFSMGGGEVARYVARHGEDRLHSIVLAGAVPPSMMHSEDNPEGPLTPEAAAEMESSLRAGREEFFPGFVQTFYSVDGECVAPPELVSKSIELCLQSDETAALACMEAFGTTDFRQDLTAVTVPTLVIHGDSDAIVPFEASGRRTATVVPGAMTAIVNDAPHGFNATHAAQFNADLLDFLQR
jgi:non-heme chloroperoxidase